MDHHEDFMQSTWIKISMHCFSNLHELFHLKRCSFLFHRHLSCPDIMVVLRDDKCVIVLCGWAGSHPKHLRKYEDLIRQSFIRHAGKRARKDTTSAARDVVCLSKTLPVEYIFSPVAWPRTMWVKDTVMEELNDAVGGAEGTVPVIVYAFSNGGGFVVEQLFELMERYPEVYGFLKSRIVGVLFDSAPGYMTPQVASRVVEEVFPVPGIRRWGAKVGQQCLGVIARLWDGKRGDRYWKMMEDLDSCPICYLYSEDDPLCDAEKLHGLIVDKLNRGHAVDSVSWAVSGHCRHYAEHPIEYRRVVDRFIGRIMARLHPNRL